jgi:multiple sugar transport system substrate-binding protein
MKKQTLVLLGILVLFGLLVWAACAAPTPQVVEKVVEKQVPVPQTVVVEKPVEKQVEVKETVVVTQTVNSRLSGPGYQPYKGKTLRILGFGGVPQFVYQAKLLHPQYEAISGVKVVFEDTPYEDLYPKITAMCAAKSDEYDIFYSEEAMHGKFVGQMDCAQELDAYYKEAPGDSHPEDWPLQTFAQMAMYQDKWVGFPGNHAVGVFAYRKDLFEDPKEQAAYKAKYGTDLKVPDDWEELKQVAQFFYRPDQKLWSTNYRYQEGNPIFSDWLIGFALSRGLQYWDDTFHPKFNSVEAIESAKAYLDPEYVATMPPGVTSESFQETQQNMCQGRIAMFTTENWVFPLMTDPDQCPFAKQIAFAQVPGWKDPATGEIHRGAMSAGIGYAINKNISEDQKWVAWDFLQFAYGKTLAWPFTYESATGMRISVHTDPVLVARWPHLTINLEQMATAVPRPQEPWWDQALFAIGRELSNALHQQKTVEQALNDANTAVEKIIKDAGYYDTPHHYVGKAEMTAAACAKYKELGLTHPECPK